MSAAILAWWHALSPREQVLIRIMLALAAVVVLVFGVVRPLRSYTVSSHDRLDAAARLRTQAAQLGHEDQRASSQTPLAERVTASAREAGFDAVLQTADADGQLRVTIAAARAPALYGWIAALEKAGVRVRQASLSTKSDATLAATLTMGDAR